MDGRPFRGIFIALCAVVSAHADGPAIVIADAYRDSLYLFTDSNDSGLFELEEAVLIYTDEAEGPDLSTPADLCLVEGRLYLLDGGSLDAVLWFEDKDGDGLFMGSGEVGFFHGDPCPGPPLRTPVAMEYYDEGFIVLDDSRVNALMVVLKDIDGDGMACSGDEWSVLYEGALAGTAEAPHDPEAVCLLPGGDILVGDASTGTIYLFTDINGDGSITGAEEILLWYSSGGGEAAPRFSCLVHWGGGVLGADRWNGRILLFVDRDSDGSIGPREWSVFYESGPSAPLLAEPTDLWVDGAGRVYVTDNGTDQILLLEDRNSDGDATDPGEAFVLLDDSSVLARPTSLVVLRGPEGPPPQLTDISPNGGPSEGGQVVTIKGGGFNSGTEVFFGLRPAPSVEVIDSGTLSVVTPPGTGAVDVTVATIHGSTVVEDGFTYEGGPSFWVDSFEPTEGPARGGFPVTFRGGGLQRVRVWFDGTEAAPSAVSSEALTVIAPPHDPGEISILLTDGKAELSFVFTYVQAAGFIRGDVDGDGALAINDAILILSILFAGARSPDCADRADVNDDGGLNIADAIRLLGYLFGGEPQPPAPFPEPGIDPTPDDLACAGA